MEDVFELIVALVVIVGGVITSSKKKKKKQPRPGPRAANAQPQSKQSTKQKRQPSAEVQAAAKPILDTIQEKLGDIEKKVDQWVETLDSDQQPDAAAAPAEMSADIQPQYLQPEPLIPEDMTATPLREAGMGEGISRMDAAGCLGGSLEHDAHEFHQGMDFHPRGAHGQASPKEAVFAVQQRKPTVSAEDLRKAVIWAEILDRPVSMRE